MPDNNNKIAVIGLGYVGLPIAVAFAKKFSHVVGFDINTKRIDELNNGVDATLEIKSEDLQTSNIHFSSQCEDIAAANFYIVTVPTPINELKEPDLSPLKSACILLSPLLNKNDVVVFESTVYPGVTEDFCGPLLEKHSTLKIGTDIKLGYSPERINPGDQEHRLETITKIISAQDTQTLDQLESVYGAIINADLHRASSIKVAESAKVIENTQRDINIALMNELSLIFNQLNISTSEVLKAAGTKWNFLKFYPGLVGGHCIGVDPYYLTAKAQSIGYQPELILAGRKINDSMGRHIAYEIIRMLTHHKVAFSSAKVAVLGITFKENVPDMRNSRVKDIITELQQFSINPLIHDPYADATEVEKSYGIALTPLTEINDLDVIVLAVPHASYLQLPSNFWQMIGHKNTIIVDIRASLDKKQIPDHYTYWSL